MLRYGKTQAGRQRWQCQGCQKTFTERQGTLFYPRKTDEQDILECLAVLAEGTRISSLSRAQSLKADPLLSLLREAAQHVEHVAAMLLNDYQISQVQIDGLGT